MCKSLLRAYYDQHTRGARTAQERQLQSNLTALDPDLHLRWCFQSECWCVYYDHNGMLSSIWSIKPGESFRDAYQSIANNGKMTKRDLIFAHKAGLEQNEWRANEKIREANHEAKNDLRNFERQRVITS